VARAYAHLLASLGKTPSGLRLPSERALAAELGVSRHSVRAAFRRLHENHDIQRVSGSGSYHAPTAADGVAHRPDVAVLDVLEARHVLEPALAALATSRATSEDFTRIGERLEAVLSETDPGRYKRAGYEMWLEIARATRNPLLLAMYRMLTECRAGLGWDQLRSMATDAEKREEQRRLAEEIWAALRARDQENARLLTMERTRNMLRAAAEIDGKARSGLHEA
jgi:DNA-binding FadR family transcriptional regulator